MFLQKNRLLPPGPVMIDLAGVQLTQEEKKRLRHPQVGGVILFARNFCDRKTLSALTTHIHQLRQEPLLIAVDQEGGRVQRFKQDGFTRLPPMRRLGEMWESDPLGAMRGATALGLVLAAELRACGVDMSFAPVLDLDYGVANSVIGDRAFHQDPRVVTMLGRALIQGLAQAGMAACGKHFPGHGFVNADSHYAQAEDTRELDTILQTDVAPYDWLGDGILSAVMMAHVVYPKVDTQPAGFSRRWIQALLRARMPYDGAVFSDDLSMEGAASAGNMLARAQAALAAGCDMVLVCNQPDTLDTLLDQLENMQNSEGSRGQNPDAVHRIRRLMPQSAALDWDALCADRRYQHACRFQSQILSG